MGHPENPAILLRNDNDGIATLTLNRPANYNALSIEMMLPGVAGSLPGTAGGTWAQKKGHQLRQPMGGHFINLRF